MRRFAGSTLVMAIAVVALAVAARQDAPPAKIVPPALPAPSVQGAAPAQTDFIQAADEVLAQMSQILSLPIKEPLKKSLRSKQDIREYLLREEKEDRTDAERYADSKTLEAFGLIPKGFPLDSFMIDILTDQVAGLYDPKAKEFYIADWIPVEEQRAVMSHELTHALEDQSFHIDPWIKAARPNDDAELARDSVSEGSALAAMVDYALRDEKMGVRDIPDVSLMIRSGAIEQMDKDPKLSKAPICIRDQLLFPYIAGTVFTQQFLKAHSGWGDLKLIFENPPASTQQILHPELYLKGVLPEHVKLLDWKPIVPPDWNLLEENVMGEFGLGEILKQLLDEKASQALSPAWVGDRYAVFEDAKTKQLSLVYLLKLDNDEDAARFFGQYSEALEKKYPAHTALFRRPEADFFQFQTENGGVFLRCVASMCLTVEGAKRETYDKITREFDWPVAPAPAPVAASASALKSAADFEIRASNASRASFAVAVH
jgi:hypothetical protein